MSFHLLKTNCFSVRFKKMVGSTHHSVWRLRKMFWRRSLLWRNLHLKSALAADSLLLKQSLGAMSLCQPSWVDYSHPINYLEERMKIHSHIFNQAGPVFHSRHWSPLTLRQGGHVLLSLCACPFLSQALLTWANNCVPGKNVLPLWPFYLPGGVAYQVVQMPGC